MLVQKRTPEGVHEFIEPKSAIEWIAYFLLVSPFLFFAVWHFHGIYGRYMTLLEMGIWHFWTWLDLGLIFWGLIGQIGYGNGPLSQWVPYLSSKMLVRFSWARRSIIHIDAVRGVTLNRGGVSETYPFPAILGVYLETEHQDKDLIGGNIAGIITAAGRIRVARCVSLVQARQVAKAIAVAARRDLEDSITGVVMSPAELEIPLALRPPAHDPGPSPTPRLQKGLTTEYKPSEIVLRARRSTDGLSGAIGAGGFLIGLCALVEFYGGASFSWFELLPAPSLVRLLTGVALGFAGFWFILLVVSNTIFPSVLFVTTKRTRFSYSNIDTELAFLEIRTGAVEEVVHVNDSGGWTIVIISGDKIIPFDFFAGQTEEETRWIADWVRWAIGRVSGELIT